MSGQNICQEEQILAYIDGELDEAAVAGFENHLDQCSACRAELTRQRQFLCELDAAIADEQEFKTPAGFARIVAVHAESDMRGVRSRIEHRRALHLIVALGLSAFALLGASAGSVIIGSGQVVLRNFVGLSSFLGETIYGAGASAAVISRALSRKAFVESGALALLVVVLVLAVLLLSHLIVSYHRARTTE
jgi:anti-sigma factor RsiW